MVPCRIAAHATEVSNRLALGFDVNVSKIAVLPYQVCPVSSEYAVALAKCLIFVRFKHMYTAHGLLLHGNFPVVYVDRYVCA